MSGERALTTPVVTALSGQRSRTSKIHGTRPSVALIHPGMTTTSGGEVAMTTSVGPERSAASEAVSVNTA